MAGGRGEHPARRWCWALGGLRDVDVDGGAEGIVGLRRRHFNYLDELRIFANSRDVVDSVRLSLLGGGGGEPHYIDMVGGILEQGCPYPPCPGLLDRPNRLHMRNERKRAFLTALEGVGLPMRGEAYKAMEAHFLDDAVVRRNFEEGLLTSSSSNSTSSSEEDGSITMRPSYRYRIEDFMEGLRKMSDVGYQDDDDVDTYHQFYIGQRQRRRREGVRVVEEADGGVGDIVSDGVESGPDATGLLNVALFLTYAIEMSILEDACDEHNTQRINGR